MVNGYNLKKIRMTKKGEELKIKNVKKKKALILLVIEIYLLGSLYRIISLMSHPITKHNLASTSLSYLTAVPS